MVSKSRQVDFLRDIFYRRREEIFLIDVKSGKTLTYREVEDKSLRLAFSLQKRGIMKGDRVAVKLPNSLECSILYFACMQIGAVIVPINTRLTETEVATLTAEATPKLFLTTVTDLWEEFEKNEPLTTRSFDTVTDSDLLAIVYTSGTTGRPKGVPIEFGKIVGNARTFIEFCGIPPGVRFLGTFSQGYLGGLYNTLLFQFIAEGSVALDAGFTAESALRFWETAAKYEVTALWPVPSMLSIILSLDRGKVGETYAREKLKFVFTGTAPLTSTLKAKFEKKYGVVLYENYALSETFFITSNSPLLPANKGVGKLVPGCHITIVDDDGRHCPQGEPGEIVVQSTYMTNGYFNNPEATARAFRDGAFYTGDVGYISPDNYLFVTDRKKDIIIRGGINISPKEIEEVISAVGGVHEVAVVGMPHPVSGEEIIAVVVGESIDADAIKNECAKHLAPFKVPARVYSVPALPKSPTGKMQKHKVKDMIKTLRYE